MKAHETIAVLKGRLELEGKSSRISDLESEVNNLREEINKLSESHEKVNVQDVLRRELERAKQKVGK